jgi:hypothetical protein
VPGAEGDCDLLKLRPDFVLHARHGIGDDGVIFCSWQPL